jgi:FtsH-binding integral membrane protein
MTLSQLIAKNKTFLAGVYGLLTAQVLVSVLFIEILRSKQELQKKLSKLWWLWMIVSFLLIIGMSFSFVPKPARLVMFFLFAIVTALMSSAASSDRVSRQAVTAAFLGAAGVFISMSVVAFVFAARGISLGFMGVGLTMALLALLVTMLLAIILKLPRNAFIAILAVVFVLFSVFVVYDTNVMLMEERDTIDAATNLYLDFINLVQLLISFIGDSLD